MLDQTGRRWLTRNRELNRKRRKSRPQCLHGLSRFGFSGRLRVDRAISVAAFAVAAAWNKSAAEVVILATGAIDPFIGPFAGQVGTAARGSTTLGRGHFGLLQCARALRKRRGGNREAKREQHNDGLSENGEHGSPYAQKVDNVLHILAERRCQRDTDLPKATEVQKTPALSRIGRGCRFPRQCRWRSQRRLCEAGE